MRKETTKEEIDRQTVTRCQKSVAKAMATAAQTITINILEATPTITWDTTKYGIIEFTKRTDWRIS